MALVLRDRISLVVFLAKSTPDLRNPESIASLDPVMDDRGTDRRDHQPRGEGNDLGTHNPDRWDAQSTCRKRPIVGKWLRTPQ
jgi:hypothetical protein